MRVQRAPHASAQPQQPPADRTPVSPSVAAPPALPAPFVVGQAPQHFVGEVGLDVSDVRRRASDEHDVMADIVVCLLAACRSHHLIDDATRLQVLTPSAEGWRGVSYEQAARQSAFGIATGLGAMVPVLPDGDPRTLRLVRLDDSGVRVSSDWGLSGLGTITVGVPTPVATPWAQEEAGSFSIATRWTVQVSLTMASSTETARAVVAALAESELTIRAHGARQ